VVARLTVLDLDTNGMLLDHDQQPVPRRRVQAVLERALDVPADVTDIFVWVHGWRTRREQARADAVRLFEDIETRYATNQPAYPAIRRFRGLYVVVRWPSWSSPLGYLRIRNRAHAMTTGGHAAHVLAQLLGYLDYRRDRADVAGVLQTAAGQYLHCVGHSFGGRFLAEAIAAAGRPNRDVLGLLPAKEGLPFAVDSLVVFQMAARPDIFERRLDGFPARSPIQGPVCLTYSRSDWAVCLWHRLSELGRRGIGCRGATAPPGSITSCRLLPADAPYRPNDLRFPIVNLDASWRYRRWWSLTGAHSDFWHQESLHLILTLADFARRP
jgi:hypothetical protein